MVNPFKDSKPSDNPVVQAVFERGERYFMAGDYENALREYAEAIRLDPNFASAWSDRGLVNNALKRHDDAISDFDEAIRLDPDNDEHYYWRGMAYEDKEEEEKVRSDNAIRDYSEAIKLNPDNVAYYLGRGMAYEDKEQYDKAFKDYSEAIRLCEAEGVLGMAYAFRGDVCVARGQYEGAIKDYNQALFLMDGSLRPDKDNDFKAVHLARRGWAYAALEQYNNALDDFKKAIDLDPQYGSLYLAQALTGVVEALVRAGQIADAPSAGSKQPKKLFCSRDPDRKPSAAPGTAPGGNPDSSFSEKVMEWIRVKNVDNVKLYKRAEIADKHFSKIYSRKDYMPTKPTAVALAIGLRLNLEETQDLLGRAGFTLSPNLPADRIFIDFISREKYDIYDINVMLRDKLGEKARTMQLGAKWRKSKK